MILPTPRAHGGQHRCTNASRRARPCLQGQQWAVIRDQAYPPMCSMSHSDACPQIPRTASKGTQWTDIQAVVFSPGTHVAHKIIQPFFILHIAFSVLNLSLSRLQCSWVISPDVHKHLFRYNLDRLKQRWLLGFLVHITSYFISPI